MTRARLAAVAVSALTLVAALALWAALPRVIGLVGLGRYDLLLRVLLTFAALSLAETISGRLTGWLNARRATMERTHDQ